jgi:hypothetical protein
LGTLRVDGLPRRFTARNDEKGEFADYKYSLVI